MHTQIQDSEIYKHMEENSNSFIDGSREERITTKLSDPVPSSQHESPLHLMKKLDYPTIQCLREKPLALPYKIQNSRLWISRMRDPYIDICRGVSQLLGF